jgi:ABC-type bacteriocin/lantibiotic exporter with double-glycine peptidase domain
VLRNLVRLVIVTAVLPGGSATARDAQGVWIDVPFVAQQREGCGAAAVAMIMQYWQRQGGRPQDPASDPERVLRALDQDRRHGIYASDLVRYLEQNGYRTFTFAGEWSDLERHVAQGRPLIAAVKPGAGLPLHYVVIAGLDPEQRLVLLNDPARRKLLKEDDARFEREWNAAGRWMLLALPKSGRD